MADTKLVATIKELQVLVAAALTLAEGGRSSRKGHLKSTVVREKSSRKALTEHILELRDAKFFKQPRTANDVHTKLQNSYPCALDRVAMSLLRLGRRRHLRKATKMTGKKKQVAYVW